MAGVEAILFTASPARKPVQGGPGGGSCSATMGIGLPGGTTLPNMGPPLLLRADGLRRGPDRAGKEARRAAGDHETSGIARRRSRRAPAGAGPSCRSTTGWRRGRRRHPGTWRGATRLGPLGRGARLRSRIGRPFRDGREARAAEIRGVARASLPPDPGADGGGCRIFLSFGDETSRETEPRLPRAHLDSVRRAARRWTIGRREHEQALDFQLRPSCGCPREGEQFRSREISGGQGPAGKTHSARPACCPTNFRAGSAPCCRGGAIGRAGYRAARARRQRRIGLPLIAAAGRAAAETTT